MMMNNELDRIVNMTNKEAAEIIKKSMLNVAMARSNGKSMTHTVLSIALVKAVEALESMPD